MKRFTQRWLMAFVVLTLGAGSATAAPPWFSLLPFKRIDADPQKSYKLTKSHGPWLVFCTSFSGPTAAQQARELVLELRSRHRIPAYIYEQSYDYTDTVDGLGLNRYGRPKKMRYLNASRHTSFAVLAGEYDSVDNPKLEDVLEKVKYMHPDCLNPTRRNTSAQQFAGFGLGALQERINATRAKKKRGQMGSAFVTRNPMLPREYTDKGGVDSFVVDMNRGVEHSLLDNPGTYTVRIASFRGETVLPGKQLTSTSLSDKLIEAAEKAHRLTVALRAKGYDAYEFHDRHESVVTVGSFQEVGRPRADGKIEINPAVHQLIETFRARPQQLGASLGQKPVALAGVLCDPQPMPVLVPRRSIAADYVPHRKLYE